VTGLYPIAWACVIAFALTVYVLCDGLDLGVGVLLHFTSDEDERARMVLSIAPIWDGNETWIVLTGVGLFGGFPVAFGTLLPALYIPLFAMLLALAFRGIAFEFRFQSPKPRLWDASFAVGSIVAAFAQGMVLGNLVHGFNVVGDTFAGSPLDAFNPLAIFTGFVVVIAYAGLAAAWLVLKTDGPLAERARRQCRLLLTAVAVLGTVVLAVAIAAGTTELRVASIAGGLLFVGFLIAAIISVGTRFEASPLRLTLAGVASGTVSICLTLFPYLVRPAITIWSANTPSNAQGLLLIGAIITIPVILTYQIFAFVVFRGKAIVPPEAQP
jgi:cytochrome bd ubiquinol oxidase subunit II